MSLFRWIAAAAVSATVAGSGTTGTTGGSPVVMADALPARTVAAAVVTVQSDEPRVEIGAAVVKIYDASGRVIAVE